jgi:hypothetical protein
LHRKRPHLKHKRDQNGKEAKMLPRNVIADGLMKLGIIKDKSEARKIIPQGLGIIWPGCARPGN